MHMGRPFLSSKLSEPPQEVFNMIILVGAVYKSHFCFVCASLFSVGGAWVGLGCTVPVALRIFQFVLGLVWGASVISRVAN